MSRKSTKDKEKEIRMALEKARARLLDVQTRGNDAISEYDLRMGYDADFYLNKCPLLANHVAYYEKKLKEIKKQGLQLELFANPQ